MRFAAMSVFASQLATAVMAQDCGGGGGSDSEESPALGEWVTDDGRELVLYDTAFDFYNVGPEARYDVFGEPEYFPSGLIRLPSQIVFEGNEEVYPAVVDAYFDCWYDDQFVDELDCQGTSWGSYHFVRVDTY